MLDQIKVMIFFPSYMSKRIGETGSVLFSAVLCVLLLILFYFVNCGLLIYIRVVKGYFFDTLISVCNDLKLVNISQLMFPQVFDIFIYDFAIKASSLIKS